MGELLTSLPSVRVTHVLSPIPPRPVEVDSREWVGRCHAEGEDMLEKAAGTTIATIGELKTIDFTCIESVSMIANLQAGKRQKNCDIKNLKSGKRQKGCCKNQKAGNVRG